MIGFTMQNDGISFDIQLKNQTSVTQTKNALVKSIHLSTPKWTKWTNGNQTNAIKRKNEWNHFKFNMTRGIVAGNNLLTPTPPFNLAKVKWSYGGQ